MASISSDMKSPSPPCNEGVVLAGGAGGIFLTDPVGRTAALGAGAAAAGGGGGGGGGGAPAPVNTG